MSRYLIICILLVLISCQAAHRQETENSNGNPDFDTISKDTVINYDIEGISAEGAVAEVNYVNSKIFKSVTRVYGETGQAIIIYEFDTDRIKVIETKYSYKTGIENVKSDKDMQLDYEIDYFIDYEGNLIGEEIQNRIDIFKEFKDVVQFELK